MKLLVLKDTKRTTISAFYQLKLGHEYFRFYLHWLEHLKSIICNCDIKETLKHLLISCSKLVTEQRTLKAELKEVALSLLILLHIRIDIKKTIAFLKLTEIATQKWHLQRREKEKEEEEEEEEKKEEAEEKEKEKERESEASRV